MLSLPLGLLTEINHRVKLLYKAHKGQDRLLIVNLDLIPRVHIVVHNRL